jgi:glucosamine 6-phosphate synthetase-like amidotransferase/phosphosugar isomerase protein
MRASTWTGQHTRIHQLTLTEFGTKFNPTIVQEPVMQSIANIKSISYLKSHAAQISEDLQLNGNPFVITQNGEASMVIESVQQFQEKEALIAALKIISMGEKDRLENQGLSAEEARAQLRAAPWHVRCVASSSSGRRRGGGSGSLVAGE